jgi:hypothetical protein
VMYPVKVQRELNSLAFRSDELCDAIGNTCQFSRPQFDRRVTDRRAAQERRNRETSFVQAEHRREQERRRDNDRRLPPEERIRNLRLELHNVLHRQMELIEALRH